MVYRNTHGRRYWEKVWSRDWRKDHLETAPLGDPSHIQSPYPDTIVDDNKYLLTGAWYRCLLRGSASTWQIQRWVLSANHGTEYKEELRKYPRRWRALKTYRRNYNMNQPVPPEFPGTKPPTKEYIWRDPWLQQHIAEDGLVGYQREERPLDLRRLIAPV